MAKTMLFLFLFLPMAAPLGTVAAKVTAKADMAAMTAKILMAKVISAM